MRATPMNLVRAFLLATGIAVTAHAAPEFTETRGWLHLNGYTHHFDAPDANDDLYGAGFTWYTRRHGTFATAWEGDVFQDSARKLCAYAGHSWTLPLRFANVGVTGALMYHRNFAKQTRACILPVALPFLETGGERCKLRIYYVPPVRSPHDHQISFQLLVPFWR
jgi:hypothetical protein